MSTRCIDHGIDYPHTPVHCPACWDDSLSIRQLQAQEESNRLKQQELSLRSEMAWEEKPLPQRRFAPSVPQHTPTPEKNVTGGMSIEPRRV